MHYSTDLPEWGAGVITVPAVRRGLICKLSTVRHLGAASATQKSISDLIRAVAKDVGMDKEPEVVSDFNNFPTVVASTVTADAASTPVIITHPAINVFLTKDQMAAIFAHEFGHIIMGHSLIISEWMRNHGHPSRLNAAAGSPIDQQEKQFSSLPPDQREEFSKISHRQEFAADQFCAEHGYAQGMISSLQISATDDPDHFFTDSVTHPSAAERITRLQQYALKAA